MTFNVVLTGVGGEGVLVTSVIVGRAAQYEGYDVGGIQLHGLAQRGGVIPTYVRFGKEVHSPTIPRGQADLILSLETIEVARSCKYASKERTNFLIDTYSISPVYGHLFGEKYPSLEEVKRLIKPFAKDSIFVGASNICREKLGSPIYGNVMTLGIAHAAGFLPLRKGSLLKAVKNTIPRGLEQNKKAFDLGLKYKV
jgi:indolepyruvate ferredoxin oxidoreductase beta subunit